MKYNELFVNYRILLILELTIFMCVLFIPSKISAQQVEVLPSDDSFSSIVAPQGEVKFQRQFYLITQDEMLESGFMNGMDINEIGFTIAVAQSDTTRGGFKVYLENSSDTISRLDTNFDNTANVISPHLLNGLSPGIYEIEIISNCGGSTVLVDTARLTFNTNNLTSCNRPTHLTISNVDSTSVTLNWYSPSSSGIIGYEVQHKEAGALSWNIDTVNSSDTLKNLTGLQSNKFYEWKVRTLCTGGENSEFNFSSFQTASVIAICNAPAAPLNASSITDTSATISWTAAIGAINYDVRYRREGTITWSNTFTFDTSFNIFSLMPGTKYVWEVRTNCSLGKGAYVSGTSFTTTGATACYSPVEVFADKLTNTSALLSWPTATGVSYTLRYRLKNSIDWINAIGPMDTVHDGSITIPKTVGPYDISFTGGSPGGSPFTYTGESVYVAYEYIYQERCTVNVTITTDSLGAETTFLLRDESTNAIWLSGGPYQNDTIINIDTSVCVPEDTDLEFIIYDSGGDGICCDTGNGSYNVSIENTNFVIYSAFTDSAATTFTVPVKRSSRNISLCNSEIPAIKDKNGQDSVSYIMSFGALSNNNLPAKLNSRNVRPETRFGSPGMKDSVEVAYVYAIGNNAVPYGNPTPVSALIKNHRASSHTYTVILNVKDTANSILFADSTDATIAGNSNQLVTFSDWSPTALGTNSILVSIAPQAGENVLNNNKNFYLQNVNPTIISYADETVPFTSAGFGTTAGLLLNKHIMNGCGKINAAQIYLSKSAENHSFRAVLLNDAGSIIDYSPLSLPIDSTQVNAYHSFYFETIQTITNSSYYIGLEQTMDAANAYYPVGVQWEGLDVRDSAYYRAPLTGGIPINTPEPGRLMIRAEIIPGNPTVSIGGTSSLCSSSSINTLTALTSSTRFANQVIDYSSQFSNNQFSAEQALGTPNVFPSYDFNPNAWMSSSADAEREYLVLGFNNPDTINFIDIYETYNPGAVDTVFVKNPNTNLYVTVYSDSAIAAPNVARINRISFAKTLFPVSEIRIAMNSKKISGFNTIDAVGIGLIDSSNANGATFLWSNNSTDQSIMVSDTGIISVTANFTGGCSSSDSVNVTQYVHVPPVITPNGDTTICVGDTAVVLTSSLPFGNIWSTGDTTSSIKIDSTVAITDSIYWVWNDNGTGCAVDTSTITVTINALPVLTVTGNLEICPGDSTTLGLSNTYSQYNWSTGSTNSTSNVNSVQVITVMATDGNGCTGSTSVSTLIATPPNPSITGTLSICPGDATTLDAGVGFSSYIWSTAESTQSISVSTAGAYTVTVTDGNGCTGSSNVTTQLLTPPSPFISGSLFFCQGESATLYANSGYSQYLWSYPTGATSISVKVFKEDTFYVTVTDVAGCTGSTSAITQVYPSAIPTITGSLDICPNSSTILDVGTNYQSYLWSTSAITHSISVNTAATYTVTVVDSVGCTGTNSVTTSLSSGIPPDVGPITGATNGLCNQTGMIYYVAPVANATFYQWTVPAQSSVISGQGDTLIVVDFGTLSGIGFISAVASNSCGQSATSTIQINTVPNIPGQISGQSTGLCNQSGKVYSILPVPGATSYNWTVPYGATIVSGQGSNSIVINFLNLVSGNIMVTASSPCGTSTGSTLAISCAGGCTNPPSLSETHNDVTCNGDSDGSIDLNVSGGTAPYTYMWSDGSSTEDVSNLSGGVYTVTVTDNINCSSQLVIFINELPAIDASILTNDPTSFCQGGSALLESVVQANVSKQWLKFGIPIGGATGDTYSAKKNGNYRLEITNSTGCVVLSNIITITKTGRPPASIVANGSTTICVGDSVELEANMGTGLTYQWIRNGKVQIGATDRFFYAKSKGNHKVIVTNSSGCFRRSNKIQINRYPRVQASVTPSGAVTVCPPDSIELIANVSVGSAPYSYQWYRFNTALTGETNSNYFVKIFGGYSVLVTDANGCTELTARTIVTEFCRVGDENVYALSSKFDLNAYPNPFTNDINLELQNFTDERVKIIIVDALGKLIYMSEEAPQSIYRLNTSEYLSGMYIIEVYQGTEVKRLKLIKTE